MKNMIKIFWKNEDAVGVVEIILILVILIALVLIFKDKITAIVNDALESIDEDSGSIIG
ncbi:MAG: holin, BlyA family protein [Lachnospiraceae bacterium]|nr:holin, BlyA family protein [Lachnospiraceae bacterium]